MLQYAGLTLAFALAPGVAWAQGTIGLSVESWSRLELVGSGLLLVLAALLAVMLGRAMQQGRAIGQPARPTEPAMSEPRRPPSRAAAPAPHELEVVTKPPAAVPSSAPAVPPRQPASGQFPSTALVVRDRAAPTLPVAASAVPPADPSRLRMMMFVDWSNFWQRWNDSREAPGKPRRSEWERWQAALAGIEQQAEVRAAWERLPFDLIDVLQDNPRLVGRAEETVIEFAGALVYDSFISDTDLLLAGVTEAEKNERYRGRDKRFLVTQIGTITGFHVHIADRAVRRQGRGLDAKVERRANGLIESDEKEVDTALTAALAENAILGRYDVALLLSDDRDCRPAVEMVQRVLGKKVVHVGFSNTPILRTACWAHISLDDEDDEEVAEAEKPRPKVSLAPAVETPVPIAGWPIAGEGGAPPIAPTEGEAAGAPAAPAGAQIARLMPGSIHAGRVRDVVKDGLWVSIDGYVDREGKERYGFVLTRPASRGGPAAPERARQKSDRVWVKFIGNDERKRILLSMKAVDQETGKELGGRQ